MIERLCDELDVPLRERNSLYLAGGFAPAHEERAWHDLGAARNALDALLRAHDPYPAVAINVRWDVLATNDAMGRFLDQVPSAVARTRPNMLRATLHPDGLAATLVDPGRWRANALRRVRRQLERTADRGLAELLAELESYPTPATDTPRAASPVDDIATPMRMTTDAGVLSMLYAVTVFGSPRDVTLDEVAIETFLPADDFTREVLVDMAGR